MIVPNDEQKKAVDEVYSWYRSKNSQQIFKLAGYAGTGKTTMIGLTVKKVRGNIAYVAYTAKAALVLRRKLERLPFFNDNDFCGTIHSLMYEPLIDPKTKLLVGWGKKPTNAISDNYNLIVIDEASMVDEFLLHDLRSYNLPILAVGDSFQLPPIEGKLNLMKSPDFTLTKIHRQAEGNPIIKLSMDIREKGFIPYKIFGPTVAKVPRGDSLKGRFIKSCDKNFTNTLILVGFNSTRVKINSKIRNIFGYEGKYPQEGEKVICLKNNYDAKNCPLSNGQTGTVACMSDFGTHLESEVNMHGESEYYFGPVGKEAFSNPKPEFDYMKKVTRIGVDERLGDLTKEEVPVDYFDFGYAMTVHKAQGSQAKRVMVVEERYRGMDDETWARWLYTAVTRAEEQLLILGEY